MNNMLLEYSRKGWKLFPCNSGEGRAKKPMIPAWPEKATADIEQIRKWTKQFPGCMWGCVTGRASGFWALDLDRAAGADGVEALKAYMHVHGLALPKTLTQRTAGGGMHLLFAMPEGADIRNATGVLPCVDVRGDGGYIIVAPSYNQDKGAAYAWHDPASAIADAPAWLIELVSKKNSGQAAPDTSAQAAYTGCGTPYGMKALQDEIAMLRMAEQGTRNDTLNRCAVKLFALAAGGELDADAVQRELESAALSIGLSYQETAATLASARRAGYVSPRRAPVKASPAMSTPEDPLPLRRPPQAQADYPVNAFLDFGQTVEDVAIQTNTPVSMVGGALLSVLSWLAQRHVNVKTKKYVTPLSLYVLIVGETGDGKSSVENILTKRLQIKEKALLRQFQADWKNYEFEMKAFERELKQLEKRKNLSRDRRRTI